KQAQPPRRRLSANRARLPPPVTQALQNASKDANTCIRNQRDTCDQPQPEKNQNGNQFVNHASLPVPSSYPAYTAMLCKTCTRSTSFNSLWISREAVSIAREVSRNREGSRGVGGPAGSKEAAKRRTKANRTVGPTLTKGVGGPAGSKEAAKRRTKANRTVGPTLTKALLFRGLGLLKILG